MNIKIYNQLNKDSKYIRETVFIYEQQFTVEFDDIDAISKHIVLYVEDNPIGVCRVYKDNEYYIIGRVAILKEYRKYGYGSIIVKAAEDLIKSLGGNLIKLSAQVRIKTFYLKLGYNCIGEEYYDEYCPHITMIKNVK